MVNSPTSSRISLKEDIQQREWIRVFLRKYLAKYVREVMWSRRDPAGSPVTSAISLVDENRNGENDKGQEESAVSTDQDNSDLNKDSHKDGEEEDEIESNLKNMITLTDVEMIEETAMGDDRITYLSRILSVAVAYTVTDNPGHFMQWLVKVPSKHFEERNLARITNAYQREVTFYAEILQDMKLWLEMNPIKHQDGKHEVLCLNVPNCYYATAQECNLDSQSKAYDFPNTEYTLILEDLRANGFGKRHYSQGLTAFEAMEAIREIVKLHAISWAMNEHSHDKALTWPNMLKWENLYLIYLDMVQKGFQQLRVVRNKEDFKLSEQRRALLDDLLNLESNLPVLLEELLKPAKTAAVTSLVHMDFWADNLLFKENQSEEEEEEVGDNSTRKRRPGSNGSQDSIEEVDIDCMIIDWQMVSLGRVSHDLGILLITSLDSNIRREYGMSLIEFYYHNFKKIANWYKLKMPFEIQDLIAQYKESCLLAVLLAVGRLDLVISEQSTMDRFFDALEDLKEEGMFHTKHDRT